MAQAERFFNVAFPIPVDAAYGDYTDYLQTYYVPTPNDNGTVRIGGRTYPAVLITSTSRFDTVGGRLRYHFIERHRNPSKTWPPVKKTIKPQVGDLPEATVNEGQLPLIYGDLEITPTAGCQNLPLRRRESSRYLDYALPIRQSGFEYGLQSMWFITSSEGNPKVVEDPFNRLWNIRIKPQNEPIVRSVGIFDDDGNQVVDGKTIICGEEVDDDDDDSDNTPDVSPPLIPDDIFSPVPREEDIRISRTSTFEFPINEDDDLNPVAKSRWQIITLFIIRVDLDTSATANSNVVAGQSSTLSVVKTSFPDSSDTNLEQTENRWLLEDDTWWRVPILLEPNKRHIIGITFDIPDTSTTREFIIRKAVAADEIARGINYGNYLMCTVNGTQAPTVRVLGRQVSLPVGSSVIGAYRNSDAPRSRLSLISPDVGLVRLPSTITRQMSSSKIWCADPVWNAYDILTNVFGYSINDIDFDAFWEMSKTVKAAVHAEVPILPSPLDTVRPLLNPLNTSLIQVNKKFTFPKFNSNEVRYCFGKSQRTTLPIIEEISDTPARSVVATYEDIGYVELSLPNPPQDATGRIIAPYQKTRLEAIQAAKRLLWPAESQTIKVVFGPKAKILTPGERIYFDANAPTIMKAELAGLSWVLELDEPWSGGSTAIVERNPISSVAQKINISVISPDGLKVSTGFNLSIGNPYVVGSPLISGDSIPYKVANISESGLNYNVVLEREDIPDRVAYINKLEGPIGIKEEPIDNYDELDSLDDFDDVRQGIDEDKNEVCPGEYDLRATEITQNSCVLTLWYRENGDKQTHGKENPFSPSLFKEPWNYQGNQNKTGCYRVPSIREVSRLQNSTLVPGLEPNTAYVFVAYNQSGCTTPNELARVNVFTTYGCGASLTVDNITNNSARLTIVDHEGEWRYQGSQDSAPCVLISATQKSADITGLSPNTEYTYSAFEADGCGVEQRLATITFTTQASTTSKTPRLIVENVKPTTARLRITNYSNAWWYSGGASNTTPGTCTSVAAGIDVVELSNLTVDASYTYSAYSASGCASANLIDTVGFSTLSDSALLSVEKIGKTFATLRVSGTTEAWSYINTTTEPATGPCVNVSANISTSKITGLKNNVAYIYSAYSGNKCGGRSSLLGRVSFNTLGDGVFLRFTDVEYTSATLILENHTGPWSYKYTNNDTCTPVDGTNIVRINNLKPNTRHYFQAYSTTNCKLGTLLDTTAFNTKSIPSPSTPKHLFFLVVKDVSGTEATLQIKPQTSYTKAWYFKGTKSGDPCVMVAASNYTYRLTNLTPDTSYTYYSYSSAGCSSDFQDAVTFRTSGTAPRMIVENIGLTEASLYILGLGTAWSYKGAPTDTCVNVEAFTSARVTGLKAGTTYIVRGYKGNACSSANQVDAISFTTLCEPPPIDLNPTLSVSNIQQNSATLMLSNYAEAWNHQGEYRAGSSNLLKTPCTNVPLGTYTTTVSGLFENTTYNFKAYAGDDKCAGSELDSIRFTTTRQSLAATLTASNITAMGATLTLANHTGAWWLGSTNSTCTGYNTSSTTKVSLTDLNPSTQYTFHAYDKTGCNAEDIIASETFTTLAVPITPAPITAITRLSSEDFPLPTTGFGPPNHVLFPSQQWGSTAFLYSGILFRGNDIWVTGVSGRPNAQTTPLLWKYFICRVNTSGSVVGNVLTYQEPTYGGSSGIITGLDLSWAGLTIGTSANEFEQFKNANFAFIRIATFADPLTETNFRPFYRLDYAEDIAASGNKGIIRYNNLYIRYNRDTNNKVGHSLFRGRDSSYHGVAMDGNRVFHIDTFNRDVGVVGREKKIKAFDFASGIELDALTWTDQQPFELWYARQMTFHNNKLYVISYDSVDTLGRWVNPYVRVFKVPPAS